MSKISDNRIVTSFSFLVIFLSPMVVGYSYMFLSNIRSEDYVLRLEDLFKFYKEGFFGILVVNLLTTLKIILGYILLIIPGILWSLDYSQCRFILACAPEKDPIEVMKESKALMKNRRGEFFVLILSYIPGFLLIAITLGIYSIWFIPRFETTLALYYDKITASDKEDNEQENITPAIEEVAMQEQDNFGAAAEEPIKQETVITDASEEPVRQEQPKSPDFFDTHIEQKSEISDSENIWKDPYQNDNKDDTSI